MRSFARRRAAVHLTNSRAPAARHFASSAPPAYPRASWAARAGPGGSSLPDSPRPTSEVFVEATSSSRVTAPALPTSSNPLVSAAAKAPAAATAPEEPDTEEDDDNEHPEGMGMGIVRLPVMSMGPGLQMMGGPPTPPTSVNDKWVAFFKRVLDSQIPNPASSTTASPPKRIVLLESAAAMSETFGAWWPSLVEAVRQWRRASIVKGKRGDVRPTTIVLSCPPSMLLPHTGDFVGTENEGADVVTKGADGQPGTQESAIRSTIASALSEKFGNAVSFTLNGDKGGNEDEKLWWASEEGDVIGRRNRNHRRLQALMQEGPSSLLPSFDSQPSRRTSPNAGHPLIDSLMNRLQKNATPQVDHSLVWRTQAIVPTDRQKHAERADRVFRRRVASVALVARAIAELGGSLVDPLEILRTASTTPRGRYVRSGRRRRSDAAYAMLQDWDEFVIPWADAQNLASMALGPLIARRDKEPSASASGRVPVQWQDVVDARLAEEEHFRQLEDAAKRHLPVSMHPAREADGGAPAPDGPSTVVDPVIEAIKKNKALPGHEKRLLGCIVEPAKLGATSFADVHLPEQTIDAVRTLVSLPLLHPEAFQGGILKQHQTQGMLMFGPPGTGKTLLARAVAKESGAHMLAIQPSDVNDMYVGEAEKLVKAVFSLARKLSPCVVFLDEVDALFGARSARDASGGAKAHNQVLTEFMQEMDGLSSAIANRDKRIVVVGATNRPFDLDDAILRRLPRRLLVDLPREEDRLAILKILLRDEHLAEDVELAQIAKDTEGYSGSDLKHVCVSAALASVKETLQLPWKQIQPTSVPAAPKSAASPRAGSAREAEELCVPPEPQTQKHEPVAAPAPVVSEASDALATRLFAARLVDGAVPSDSAAQACANAASSSTSTVSAATGQDVAVATPGLVAAPASAQEPLVTPPPARVIRRKHFETALSEIRPSATEEGTLPELRRWAEQFGEGGKKRGSKSGFGKGFGFGDEAAARDAGYGRVTQDE
ncbi:hypothetical protein Q5752_005767 [Cryptotrichosporon argae]